MKIKLVLFLCVFTNQSLFAQSHQLTGKLIDQNNKGIDLAKVSLLQLSDSSFVNTSFTDEDGSFLLSKLNSGTYLLHIQQFGFETKWIPVEVDSTRELTTLPNHVLTSTVNKLEEVNVVATKPYIERKMDRMVINVDENSSNAGSNILEVLGKAPGISVDNNGALLLKGRSGVAVFINDKPSYLSGTELESYLRSLPAGSVKSIEIMTNPPAKYDAAGNAGVINIILKKNKLQGFNGNVSLSFRHGYYASSNNSLQLNYAKNKFNFYANTSAGFWNSFQDLNINRQYRNEENVILSNFDQNSYDLNKGKYLNETFGMDYYLNEKTSIGISYKINGNNYSKTIDNKSRVSDASSVLMQHVLANNATKSLLRNDVYNTYFNRKLDTLGSTISIDADYVRYKSNSDQLFQNRIFNENNELTLEDRINGALPSDIQIFALKSDYLRQFKNDSKFEAGVKSAFTKTNNQANYSTTINEITTPNYQLSNTFLYSEWINAAYLNYMKTLGRIDIQLGLRLESTQMNGNQLGNIEKPDSSFTRNYLSAFPTFYASWKMDSLANNTLVLSYGRRIDRPFFQDLNPFISPLDKFTFYAGNPNLLPTFSNELSLTYSYKSLFSTSLYYSKTKDVISETLEIKNGIYYSRPGNLDKSQSLSLSVQGSIPVTKWYNINSYLELTQLSYQSKLYTEQLNSKGTFYYLSATNSFTLGKGWSIDLGGFYKSSMVYAQLDLVDYGQVFIGIQKKILKNTGSIKLSVNDLFYTNRGGGVINNLQLTTADWNSVYDSRTASLTFSWRFGKSTMKREKHSGNGSGDEQNRLKG